MILSIDLNPVLKRKYYLDCLDLARENIPENIIYGPGGDGIELAYLLYSLNEEVLFSGYLGGTNGEHIHKILTERGIANDCYRIRDETSDNIIISLDNSSEIIIKEKMPRITRDEIGGLYELYLKNLTYNDMVCFVGETPVNISDEIFYDFVSIAKKHDKLTMLGLKDKGLVYGIEAAPFLVLLDKKELENITKLKLDFEYEIIKAGQYLLDKGINYVVIELGSRGSLVLTEKVGYRIEVNRVDKVDCKINYGYMIGGFALAIKRKYDLDMMLKLGQACGIVNCFNNNGNIDMSDIKKIMGQIEISTFNY